MFATSYIELNRTALRNNLRLLHKLLGKKTILSSVIKGNAYGHGIEKYVPLAEELGVKHFSVFSADEALRALRASTNHPTIMIMGMIDDEELAWAIRNHVEFYVTDVERLKKVRDTAAEIGIPARIHLQVETGMNRMGLEMNQIDCVLPFLANPNIEFTGLCTHYAGAESIANYVRIKNQIKNYRKIEKFLASHSQFPRVRHTASSAATVVYPQTRLDIVRVGILCYGLWPSQETFIHYIRNRKNKIDPLKRIISWKSRIMNVKKVKTGEFIGYGTSYLAHHDMTIATIPVGYGHGFSRSLSNTGRVLIHGQRVSVVGLVNMNMMTVDVTSIGDVHRGDEAVLIGKQGDLEISISSFGQFSSQLNYELLTRLPLDIPRIIVN